MLKVILFVTCYSVYSFPILMFYQGMLTDSTGKPIQTSDSIRVQLHNSTSSTTPLWQETHFVTTKNGAFSVLLGKTLPLPINHFTTNDSLFFEFHQQGRNKTSRTRVGINAFTVRSLYSDSAKVCAKSNIADTANLFSGSKWTPATENATTENLAGPLSFTVLSKTGSSLVFGEKKNDTTINRAKFRTDSSGMLSIDISNASGTVEAKSVVTIKAGSDVLSVAGSINASSFKASGVTLNVPDYVFEPDYNLSPLSHVENYITQHRHLPEIPSAAEINSNGMDVVDMNLRLLRKIEELTLHLISQEKKLKELETAIEQWENKERGSP